MFNKNYVLAVFCLLFCMKVNAADIEFPVYGNWCGPGHPAQGHNPKSIDLLDEACKVHDLKYRQCQKGKNKLTCEADADFELVNSLHNNYEKLNQAQQFIASHIGRFIAIQGSVKITTENTRKLPVIGSQLHQLLRKWQVKNFKY